MKRRTFIAGVGSAAAWPAVLAWGQPAAVPVIGLCCLGHALPNRRRPDVAAFHRGLAETGFVEGQNVAVEYRWTEDRNDRLPDLAADLVRRQVAVIVTLNSTPAAVAAKAATRTIPVVSLVGVDPVEYGLVESLARPGGNITGFASFSKEASPDGYTVGIGNWGTHVGLGAICRLDFDLLKDFEPVALLPSNPMLVVTRKNVPATNLKELIGWLKSNQDKVSVGTSGVGGGSHVAGVFFQNMIGARFQFVPYRGAGPAMNDLVAGQILLMPSSIRRPARCATPRSSSRCWVPPPGVPPVARRCAARGILSGPKGSRHAMPGRHGGPIPQLATSYGCAESIMEPTSYVRDMNRWAILGPVHREALGLALHVEFCQALKGAATLALPPARDGILRLRRRRCAP